MTLKLQINAMIAVNACLAALLVGLAQGMAVMPLAVLSAALLGLRYTDATARFHLNRLGINAVVVVAAIVFAVRYANSRGGTDMFIAADALAMLQIGLFFEDKGPRTWWDLLSLSLLQVVLASVAPHGPFFLPVIIGFAFSGLAAMLLLHQYRVVEDAQAATGSAHALEEQGMQGAEQTDWLRLLGIAAGTLIVGPLSLYLRFGRFHRPGSTIAGPSESQRAIRLDETMPAPVTARELWRKVGGMTLFALVCGYGVFAFVPRTGRFEYEDFMFRRVRANETLERSVGFNRQIDLDEQEDLVDDRQVVLEARFQDLATRSFIEPEGDLYFRGVVLNQYGKGSWDRELYTGQESPLPLGTERIGSTTGLVRQLIKIQPLDEPDLFGVWPYFLTSPGQQDWFDIGEQRLYRPFRRRGREFSYQLVTNGFRGRRQAEFVPALSRIDPKPLLRVPERKLAYLSSLAERWLREENVTIEDPVACARELERRLGSSPDFEYSTRGVERLENLDPIEDFVRYRRQGHCEYFASALALMLRSRGLPARMVVGFKTSERGENRDRILARQGHAHAWVEMYVPPDKLPASVREDPRGDWSRGGWMRLDPTPGAAGSTEEGLLSMLKRWVREIREAWSDHVLRMNRTRQQRTLYGPIFEWLKASVSDMGRREWWEQTVWARFRQWLTNPAHLLADLGRAWGLLVALLAVVAGGVLIRELRRRRSRGEGPGDSRRAVASIPRVDFYRRLERLLASGGIPRGLAQTPREYARERARQLARSTGQSELVPQATLVVDAFYQLRFGGAGLAPEQSESVELALQKIRHAARQRNGPNGHSRE